MPVRAVTRNVPPGHGLRFWPPRERRWHRYEVAPGESDGRVCENCGELLNRRMYSSQAEPPKRYERRRFCSVRCRSTVTERSWVDSDGPPWTIDSNGCWSWDRRINEHGYGTLAVASRMILAHVWVYEMAVGTTPEGMELDHLCRNRACVNPDHLEPVTHAENMRRGATAKLSAKAVAEIRESELSAADLAAAYGVSRSQIHRVRSGRAWQEAA